MDRPTVFFHIGAPKTGTTYLQQVLTKNKPALRRNGLLYAGTATREHFLASQDLREQHFKGYEDPHLRGAWDRLVKEVRGWSGTSFIGHESFASANRAQIERAMNDLSFADVHLVVTARDMARQLPATWQERVRNRGAVPYGDFLQDIRPGRAAEGSAAKFWSLHGIPGILHNWSRGMSPDHVHVVTVPPAGSDSRLLWERFATLLGLDPHAYETQISTSNSSLGAVEAEVLRRFNAAIADLDIPWPVYTEAFKRGVAPKLSRRVGERIELPEDAYEWCVQWSIEAVGRLREAGYDVVGDLEDLIPKSRPTGQNPDTVPGDAQAEVAIAGMVALLSVMLNRMNLGKRGRKAAPMGDGQHQPPGRSGIVRVAHSVEWPEFVRRGYRKVQARRSGSA